MDDRIRFLETINANPRDRAPQLIFADWLAERGDPRESFWRCESEPRVGRGRRGGRVGLGGRVGRVGLAGLVGLGGLGGRVGLAGLVGLVGLGGRCGLGGRVGLVGRVGRVGLGGRVGLVGRGGRVGLVGRAGLVGPFHPEGPIVLIPGENAVVFLTDGYYTSVLIGHVAQELPHGWIVDPCWELLSIGDNDTLIELAAGKKAGVRRRAKVSDRVVDGFRVPFGCPSMKWQGELPAGGEGRAGDGR